MADLVQLSVKQLRKRADELHVSRERIEAARDGDDPRHDLITLIQEAAEPAVNRHRNPSYTFDDLELGRGYLGQSCRHRVTRQVP